MRTIFASCLLTMLLSLPLLAQSPGAKRLPRPDPPGQLAVVTVQHAEIRSAPAAGRILSVCPQGQYLAVTRQTADQYTVLMQDHHTGYIAAAAVKLLGYQVATDVPEAVGRLGGRLAESAKSYLGVPYRRGGYSQAGMDSAALVQAVYRANGIALPRAAVAQAAIGYDIPRRDPSQWQTGDRLYFACRRPRIDHTALYLGDGYFIHVSLRHGRQVAIDSLDDAYYARHLVAVRRSVELIMDRG